jgi:hypothetical protein
MNIAYIVKTRKNKYRPFVGTPVKDDDDSFMNVLASGELMLELKEAQDFITSNREGIDRIYLNPVPSGMVGISWMSEIESANS